MDDELMQRIDSRMDNDMRDMKQNFEKCGSCSTR